MGQNKILLISGILLLLLALVMAFDDNLSELAPLFLVLGMGCFGWLIYKKTGRSSVEAGPVSPRTMLAKVSSLLGLAGLAGIGLGGLSFLDSSLEEFYVAGIVGALLLVFALLVRIANGIYTKRVDAATGGFSIAVILILLIALAVAALVIYFIYLLFSW